MRKILNWLVYVFVFTIPVFQFLSAPILVLLVLLSMYHKHSRRMFVSFAKRNWDILFYAFVLIVGVTYSQDKHQALKVLETSFCALALPLVFHLHLSDHTEEEKLVSIFSSSVVFALVTLVSYSSYLYYKTSNVKVFQYYQLTELIGIQPTYMAYYIIFVVTIVVFNSYYDKWKWHSILLMGLLLFLFLVLLLTGGETSFISIILIWAFFALKFLLDVKSVKKQIVVASVTLILILFSVVANSEYFQHFFLNQTDYWERADLWRSAIFANQNPLIGVGTGDYQNILNQYYDAKGMSQYAASNFNSHNQFVQLYFSNGFLGLMAIFLLIGRPLYLSFKSQNLIGILIIFPFIIYGITEVFLGRFQGIVFFVFCHQLVIAQYYLIKPKLILSKENVLST